MINFITDNRRVNELAVQIEIRRQSAQGGLFSLIRNALLSNTKHLRGELVKLCQLNGYSALEARRALYIMERCDWLKTEAIDTQVFVFVTLHAQQSAGGA